MDLETEKRNADFVRSLIEQGLVNAVHDVSEGGVACAAAEMGLSVNLGWTSYFPVDFSAQFGEGQGRVLVAIPSDRLFQVEQMIAEAGCRWDGVFAEMGGDQFVWRDQKNVDSPVSREFSIPLSRLREAHEGWLPAYMVGVD